MLHDNELFVDSYRRHIKVLLKRKLSPFTEMRNKLEKMIIQMFYTQLFTVWAEVARQIIILNIFRKPLC